ncbi:MAG: GNAT family N-acetyltransferase [Halothiobacillaceae bacterium]
MEFAREGLERADEISVLFQGVFSESEGAEEGHLIGDLADRLVRETPEMDRMVFSARENGLLLAVAIFSRLWFAQDERVLFVLGPVAVRTERQRQGIGGRLLRYALTELRAEGVDGVLTYGDPAYYARVGFRPVDEALAPAPYCLQYPSGWLGQSLTGVQLTPLRGPSRCVAALDNPAFW